MDKSRKKEEKDRHRKLCYNLQQGLVLLAKDMPRTPERDVLLSILHKGTLATMLGFHGVGRQFKRAHAYQINTTLQLRMQTLVQAAAFIKENGCSSSFTSHKARKAHQLALVAVNKETISAKDYSKSMTEGSRFIKKLQQVADEHSHFDLYAGIKVPSTISENAGDIFAFRGDAREVQPSASVRETIMKHKLSKLDEFPVWTISNAISSPCYNNIIREINQLMFMGGYKGRKDSYVRSSMDNSDPVPFVAGGVAYSSVMQQEIENKIMKVAHSMMQLQNDVVREVVGPDKMVVNMQGNQLHILAGKIRNAAYTMHSDANDLLIHDE